jgi:hypothetical protein
MDARIAPAAASLLLLNACSEPSGVQLLQSRTQASINPAQACNRPANVEYSVNGARVRIPDSTLFVVGRTDVSDCGRFVLAGVVEAMLDPRVMQVVVEPGADTNAPDAFLPRKRADNVKASLSNAGFASGQPPVLVQPASAASAGVWGVVLAVAN